MVEERTQEEKAQVESEPLKDTITTPQKADKGEVQKESPEEEKAVKINRSLYQLKELLGLVIYKTERK